MNADFKARAIIVVSGLCALSPVNSILEVLASYALRVDEHQQILMEGRFIGAFAISFDPAHSHAIEDELVETFGPQGLDVALELL